MAWRHWLIVAIGAAGIVSGVLLIVAESTPHWLPDWNAEHRLVWGLAFAFGGFVVGAIGGLAGLAYLQSMGGRLDRGGRYVSGPALVIAALLGTAGGLVGWYPETRNWVPALRQLRPDHRQWVAWGSIAAAGLVLVLFGRRRTGWRPGPSPLPPKESRREPPAQVACSGPDPDDAPDTDQAD